MFRDSSLVQEFDKALFRDTKSSLVQDSKSKPCSEIRNQTLFRDSIPNLVQRFEIKPCSEIRYQMLIFRGGSFPDIPCQPHKPRANAPIAPFAFDTVPSPAL
ncbi:hypothetical protein AVEN_270431-1 [Araneus ventricosus]|uniref:Uncharacterized protein n=1 Tax=Araneus ventricosus TaxID=182803 RepID=A0A4Y2RJ98_ARAVE|nr:hypothetical protein AVEN_270431-1 [Araneus ventricosus]